MNKELVYENIYNLINNGFFIDKYIELTTACNDLLDGIELDFPILSDSDTPQEEKEEERIKRLEDVSARIFNAIIIGCQLFDDEERIKKFVDTFSYGIEVMYMERILPEFGISKEEALDRLNHGFVVHFTTPRIANEIKKTGRLVRAGKNAMFTEEEDKIIYYAEQEQKKNNPEAEQTLNYLYRGWGTGVSSYGSITNQFWMYHTPESLSFLFGNISNRNKEESMKFVSEKVSHLENEDKKLVIQTMSNIYDRLIGEEQNVSCILIDRDSFEYEIDYYYNTGEAVPVERRPFNNGLSGLSNTNSLIKNDIEVNNLRFLEIPTVLEFERQKQEKINAEKSIGK